MAIPEDKVTSLMDLLKIPVEKRNFEELWNQIQNLIEKDRFKRYYISMNDNSLEKILNNPGLQHLAEKIFDNLKYEDLKVCQGISQSSKKLLDYQMNKPMFLLKKFSHLSKENKKDWIEVIQSVKNSDKEKAIISYLQWNLKKDSLVDLPCYSSFVVQNNFRRKIWEICATRWQNSPEKTIEIVKILAPLTDNPNAPDKCGNTPIHVAALNGHTEIVKIMAPLTDNPNAPNQHKITPIHVAVYKGHTEIVKILAPLTNNPNAPCNGRTPIYWAAYYGYTEIVKILAPLTDNPNAPGEDGKTPISIARYAKIRRILESFNTSRKRKSEPPKKPSKKRAKKF